MSDEDINYENVDDIPNDSISTRRRAEKKKGGGANEKNASFESGVAGVAGTGGSSGAGSVRSNVRELGDISGLDPELDEDEIPVPGTIGKGKAGARDKQMSDGGMPGRTRGPDGETVPNQHGGGKKGQKGQRDGHQSDGTQS